MVNNAKGNKQEILPGAEIAHIHHCSNTLGGNSMYYMSNRGREREAIESLWRRERESNKKEKERNKSNEKQSRQWGRSELQMPEIKWPLGFVQGIIMGRLLIPVGKFSLSLNPFSVTSQECRVSYRIAPLGSSAAICRISTIEHACHHCLAAFWS